MPRSGEQARRRLQQAALELYVERGFDATTAAEIATRAGVTERTYFRHFADKREVLFEGEAALGAALAAAVGFAPPDLAPLPALLNAFRVAAAPILEADRPFAMARHQVISGSPALRERELAKGESLKSVLAVALEARGVGERVARLAVEVGWIGWAQAIAGWLKDPSVALEYHLTMEFDRLSVLVSEAGR